MRHVDAELAIGLTREFVRVRTTNPPGDEVELARLLAGRAEYLGLHCEIQPLDDHRANAIVRLPGRSEAPAVMYCGHLDTVQLGAARWDHDPLGAEIARGLMYGRGTCDMKAGLAAMLAGMAAIRASGSEPPGDLILAAVVGEEVDCLGSRALLAEGGMAGVGWLVIAEPTGLDVVVAHKGAIRLEITVFGRSAHGAMPQLGVNAISYMTELICRLDEVDLGFEPHPHLASPSVSVNTIDGGTQPNVIADRCSIGLDIRTVPGQRHERIVDSLRRLGADVESSVEGLTVMVDIRQDVPPVETPEDHPISLCAQKAAARVLGRSPAVRGVDYFSDASVLQPATGVPTILFGPGDEKIAHQVDEHVDVEAISKAARTFAVLPFLGWPSGEPTAMLSANTGRA
jgi:succinyl-diaminopimelate desuccinylase